MLITSTIKIKFYILMLSKSIAVEDIVSHYLNSVTDKYMYSWLKI